MIKQEFLKKMQEKKYFQDHRRVLVAVSGGLDSMTLLQLLIDSQKELAIELAIFQKMLLGSFVMIFLGK